MITKIYRVKGSLVLGDETQVFTKEYKATCESDIEEKVYSLFGSKHRINRNQIQIDSIEEIAAEDVQDPILKAIL
ncbi:MAG: 50S ribosomal protein L18Ae [archaeon]|nr:50S ribosomal protein L18Ae [archaeon]